MGGLVYFSSASGNTRRFIEKMKLPATRVPRGEGVMPSMAEPFVLVCPTYADGQGRHAVPKQVIRFLNRVENRQRLRGVIASGNRNFGEAFALAGHSIARKCSVPLLYRFELAGTEQDIVRIREGLARFWAMEEEMKCLTQA